jgi:predicted outer membrane protein
MGKLAVQKATDERVKQFGQKMIDDHTERARFRGTRVRVQDSADAGGASTDDPGYKQDEID